jgi:hypothetical protein
MPHNLRSSELGVLQRSKHVQTAVSTASRVAKNRLCVTLWWARLVAALDAITDRWGAGTLDYASSGLTQAWKMQCHHRSPSYTTDWNEASCRPRLGAYPEETTPRLTSRE